jgi:hypothetical protein
MSRHRLGYRIAHGLRLNVFAEISGWKSRRAFLTSHVPGSTSTVKVEPQKENLARSALFYFGQP